MNQTRTLLLIALVMPASLVAGQSKGGDASSPNPQQASSNRNLDMKINIKIGEKILTATLADSATARDFAPVLPLNVSMDDLFGREKFGKLPKALSENGPRTHSYKVGDIAYWSPAHDVAIYYRQDSESIPSPGIIPIGTIDAGAEAFNVPGSVKVTIEVKQTAGSNTGGIRETQDMLDFCAVQGIKPQITKIPMGGINDAWSRVVAKQARFRFVMDMNVRS
jgi:hypothetical protein